ncbi:MAG: histidine phosphatase family protein [Mycobacteriaceae bacterium]
MTVLLIRHGRSTANTSHSLAGRTEGIELDALGMQQAENLVHRLSGLPLKAIIRSPLLRCAQTVKPLAEAHNVEPIVEDKLLEVDYGQWTGRKLSELVAEPLWSVVQNHPSAAQFPEGESLQYVQARSVQAIREHDRRLRAENGHDTLWVACTHGDIIKSVLADALGLHLDSFQRIIVDPGSISVVRYTKIRPFVLHMNHTGNEFTVSPLAATENKDGESDGVVGGAPGSSQESRHPAD